MRHVRLTVSQYGIDPGVRNRAGNIPYADRVDVGVHAVPVYAAGPPVKLVTTVLAKLDPDVPAQRVHTQHATPEPVRRGESAARCSATRPNERPVRRCKRDGRVRTMKPMIVGLKRGRLVQMESARVGVEAAVFDDGMRTQVATHPTPDKKVAHEGECLHRGRGDQAGKDEHGRSYFGFARAAAWVHAPDPGRSRTAAGRLRTKTRQWILTRSISRSTDSGYSS